MKRTLAAMGMLIAVHGTGVADTVHHWRIMVPNPFLPVQVTSNEVLCQHVLQTYPSDHLLLEVKGFAAVQIHCGDRQAITPVHVTFERVADLDWYRVHEGYRDVIQGETDKD